MAFYIRCGCLGFLPSTPTKLLNPLQSFPVWSSSHCFVSSNVDANLHVSAGLILSSHKMGTSMWDFLKSIGLRGYVDTYLGISFHDVQGHCNCWPTLTNRKWRASKMWMTWGIFWISEQRYIYVVTPTKTSWSIYQLHYKKREGRFSKNFKVIIWNSFVPLFGEFLHWNFSTNFKFLFYIIPALVQMEKKHSQQNWLVVEPTPLKNMLVKMGIFPNFRGENKKYGWNHHTENHAANRCKQNPPIHQILQLLSFV